MKAIIIGIHRWKDDEKLRRFIASLACKTMVIHGADRPEWDGKYSHGGPWMRTINDIATTCGYHPLYCPHEEPGLEIENQLGVLYSLRQLGWEVEVHCFIGGDTEGWCYDLQTEAKAFGIKCDVHRP
jgi:hypothetical protein